MYSGKQRGLALFYGVFCHLSFAVGIAAMMLGLYTGLRLGRGPLTGIAAVFADVLLALQSPARTLPAVAPALLAGGHVDAVPLR